MNLKLNNVKALMGMASQHSMKTLVTYEISSEGNRDMPEEIKSCLPTQNISQVNKTYFDITKKSEIANAIEQSNVKNILICGAETDVCVLQSVTGLLKKGYQVYLLEDAVYTSTTLNKPALSRMEMSGAKIVKTAAAISAVNASMPISSIDNPYKNTKIAEIVPSQLAFVIANVDDQSLEKLTDPKKNEKLMRIKYICQYSEIFDIPAYFVYTGSIDGLKGTLNPSPNIHYIKAEYNTKNKLRSLVSTLKDKGLTHIAFGGINENNVIFQSAKTLTRLGLDIHLMEDSLFESGNTDAKELDNLYKLGVIPSSLKIIFYDHHKTASLDEWPPEQKQRYLDKIFVTQAITWIESLPFVVDSQ